MVKVSMRRQGTRLFIFKQGSKIAVLIRQGDWDGGDKVIESKARLGMLEGESGSE